MDLIQKINDVIEPPLESMGYSLVLAKMADGARRKTLTIMAERKDGRNMDVSDCTEISRTISALLEVEDPITGAYDLEVCSPGMDRPLIKVEDFKKHLGYEIKIETMLPLKEHRKRFRGILKAFKDGQVFLNMADGEVEIAFDNIRSAKLVVNDEMLKKAMNKEKMAQ